MVSPTILSVRQRTVSHTRITTAALSFTLSGLMATPDPSLALTTLHFTFTPSPPLEKKFFFKDFIVSCNENNSKVVEP
jgi:hypothetical protein